MATTGYESNPRSTVNRLGKQRGRYDYDTIHTILDTCPVVHVSFNPTSPDADPFPTILPMLGCTAAYKPGATVPPPAEPQVSAGAFPLDGDESNDSTDEVFPLNAPRSVYIHGYVSSRLMKASEGTPVCIAATHMDGIVLSLTPFHNSCNYRSAVIYGYAHQVTDEEERDFAMHIITNNVLRAQWENSRTPPTKAELTTTGILRVEIVSASAKVRTGGPGDDRHDLKNEEVINNVYTGVIPSYIQYGEPVSSDYNRVRKVPAYINQFIREENAKHKDGAYKAIETKMSK